MAGRVPENKLVMWDDGKPFNDSGSDAGSSSSSASSRSKDKKSKRKTHKDVKRVKKSGKKDKESSRRPRKATTGTFSSRYTTWKKVPVDDSDMSLHTRDRNSDVRHQHTKSFK